MNQEKQRIAIAKAVGGVYKPCACGHCGGEFDRWHWPDDTITDDCPDYLNDLNVMHEAEMWLAEHSNGTFANDYPAVLEHIVDPDRPRLGERADPDRFDLYCATAAQRAEAFLKTLGLWTEEE